MKNTEVVHIILEEGRESRRWFATSKQFPGLEGIGENPSYATSDFLNKATKLRGAFMFKTFKVTMPGTNLIEYDLSDSDIDNLTS